MHWVGKLACADNGLLAVNDFGRVREGGKGK